MGNCFRSIKKSAAEIAPSEFIKGATVVRLYGSPGSIVTSYLRFALLHKPVSIHFIPSIPPHFGSETPVLQLDSDVVSGSPETMLGYLDSKFPNPPLTRKFGGWCDDTTPPMVRAVMLQHRSMNWHLERMVRWAEDLVRRGGRATGDPVMGSPRMEVRKFGRSYSQLLEILLEHAQMEERLVFPVLERADRGLCKTANEEHARDLPIMNGIKEDIKSVSVLDSQSPVFQEALSNLSTRIKTLQDHCKEHFEEEEKELLPLMEATDLNRDQQERMLEQILDLMIGTHSHLFPFLIEGLIPCDAIHYLDLIINQCNDEDRVSSMFNMIV